MNAIMYVGVLSAYRPRRFGGCNYELSVFKIKHASATVEHVGTVSRCTAAHKGEDAEARCVVLADVKKHHKAAYKRYHDLLEERGCITALCSHADHDTYGNGRSMRDAGIHFWMLGTNKPTMP